MPEVVRLEDVIRIGRSRDDFRLKIEEALNEDDPELVRKRQDVARANSWPNRIELIVEIISKALGDEE
jgi:hypothetical protein